MARESLTATEINEREKAQRELTAKYLRAEIGLDEYKAKMNKVATPIDLVALASKLGFVKK
ncbi:MAG: hypothetical protein WA152_00400 [Microgenomates group bacterium]